MSYNRSKNSLLTLSLLLASLNVYSLKAASPSLVGTPFPELSGGSTESIAAQDLKGKIVMYDFWASWCPPCKASFPVMQSLVEEYGDQGFTVIAINEDEKPSKMTKFLKRQKVSFPIHHDVNHTLIESLKVKTMPSAFLVDQDGMIHSVHEGFHEKTSGKAYRKAIESLLKKR
ncbi:MAG: TlpA family protein disulfide reductase [Verrucomicrobia bacterium]|jgi:cytochrome c biogenesis protein CcmG, thiol:disulfide interchange protein DsbE|nr:TlpA family protein disulfide reductase [Verrucomicrobiota bacterium]MDA7511449.1 TlpA family protein disulfide reductase [Verrucomicrobiota bacterium]